MQFYRPTDSRQSQICAETITVLHPHHDQFTTNADKTQLSSRDVGVSWPLECVGLKLIVEIAIPR